jgi:predicted amidophosphoribosyltransferase
MKICPKCQIEYDDTKNFCRHDGSPLEAKKAEGETAKGVDLTCPQCGKPVEAGKKFCRHCGARLEVSTQPLTVEAGTAAPSFMHTKPLAEEKCLSTFCFSP